MHFSTLLTATTALAVGVSAGRDKKPPKHTSASGAQAWDPNFLGPRFAHHVKGRATSINIIIDGDASTAAAGTVSPIIAVEPATAKPSSSASTTKQSKSKAAEPTATEEPSLKKAKKAGKDQKAKIAKDDASTTTLAEAEPSLGPIFVPIPLPLPSGHDKSESETGTVTVTMTKTITVEAVPGGFGNINAVYTPDGNDIFGDNSAFSTGFHNHPVFSNSPSSSLNRQEELYSFFRSAHATGSPKPKSKSNHAAAEDKTALVDTTGTQVVNEDEVVSTTTSVVDSMTAIVTSEPIPTVVEDKTDPLLTKPVRIVHMGEIASIINSMFRSTAATKTPKAIPKRAKPGHPDATAIREPPHPTTDYHLTGHSEGTSSSEEDANLDEESSPSEKDSTDSSADKTHFDEDSSPSPKDSTDSSDEWVDPEHFDATVTKRADFRHLDATAIRTPFAPTTHSDLPGHASFPEEDSSESSSDELAEHVHPNVTLTNNDGDTITGYVSVSTDSEDVTSTDDNGTSTEGGGSSTE